LQKEYVSIEEVIAELKSWLSCNPDQAKQLDFVTISGMGEPTLNSRIGEVIAQAKKLTDAKIAVITNSSLLRLLNLRLAMREADLIVPSLDAADEATFQEIDRPDKDISLEDIVNGLAALRREFRGKIWLEVMVVKGLNDSLEHARNLKELIDRINPDKVQLNSPVRTTAESEVLPADKGRLEKICEILGDKCEIF
jgi:wyosine [tRNA(Phe)-imidazoG37] synthetase (radical SAM superfamily)